MQISPLDNDNLYLYNIGKNFRSYQLLGAHLTELDGIAGVRFAVWAPQANAVSVVGDFNSWDGSEHAMARCGDTGVWQCFVPELGEGAVYKYQIDTAHGRQPLKADPYGFYAEVRPNTGSVVCDLNNYVWQDADWQRQKQIKPIYEKPVLIYEVHLGSWRFNAAGDSLSYRECANQLVEYVAGMGYTHVELMPLMEHPFDGSWGYQATGYYAVTSRYGEPADFMYLVDCFHARGIGVIMDWAPSHFCKDDHGLRRFDGTPLYEPADSQRGENYEWGTANFDFSRAEVHSFLVSNALFWLDIYHIDGIRVDAVANILYLDYGRKAGEWTPNRYGGNGDLDGMLFLRTLNEAVFANVPAALMIAEESTSWPMVSWPTYLGGLGFNFKWNMGWMNDMLKYVALDPIHRKWNHSLVTFSLMYAFSENFILPLSHDEVVHGKKSLLDKMPGDYWQKFANLRAFYGYWMAHPGKKLLFMGGEFGQFIEWKYDDSLDWHLLEYPLHQALHCYVRDLNHFYCQEPSLWQIDHNWQGFSWIDCSDYSQSVLVFMRQGKQAEDFLIVVCNFTPEVRHGYRIGVPRQEFYQEVFNSDSETYGGSGVGNTALLQVEAEKWHNQPYSLTISLPPLATLFLRPAKG